jgi:hypothetical protein
MIRLKFICFLFVIISLSASCRKADVTFSDNLTVETTQFSIEKLTCDFNSSVQWTIDKSSNYLQKNIATKEAGNLRFVITANEFCSGPYAFRIIVFVNNKITFRRTIVEFPFENTIAIPENSTTSVQTYVERNPRIKDECENIGRVSNRVYLQ